MLKVSHIVNSVFSSRTYFLPNDVGNEFWLVDCGDVSPLREAFSSMSGGSFVVKGVLLTHAHFDHIYGLPRLTELFPEVKVYTNEAGRRTLADSRRNLSRYHGEAMVYESDNVVVCGEEDVVDLFDGVSASVYETPGHHPSCLTFEVGGESVFRRRLYPGRGCCDDFAGGGEEFGGAVAGENQVPGGG